MKKFQKEEYLRQKLYEMKEYERGLYKNGITFIAGVDEVGRGPLAGPVTAAAVIFPEDIDILGIDDSKKLSEKKREELSAVIREKALAYGIGSVDEKVIDEINILEATRKAMKKALEEAGTKLGQRNGGIIQHILLDAVSLDDVDIPQTPLIHGDSLSVSIAAASIIAKVERDSMMREYHKIYPDYAFDSNKGYGTKAHCDAIREKGICRIHRRTFVKNYTNGK